VAVGGCMYVFVALSPEETALCFSLSLLHAQRLESLSVLGGDDSLLAGGCSVNTKRKSSTMKVKLKSLDQKPHCCHRGLNNKNLQKSTAQELVKV
jgi:hypothetical protein